MPKVHLAVSQRSDGCHRQTDSQLPEPHCPPLIPPIETINRHGSMAVIQSICPSGEECARCLSPSHGASRGRETSGVEVEADMERLRVSEVEGWTRIAGQASVVGLASPDSLTLQQEGWTGELWGSCKARDTQTRLCRLFSSASSLVLADLYVDASRELTIRDLGDRTLSPLRILGVHHATIKSAVDLLSDFKEQLQRPSPAELSTHQLQLQKKRSRRVNPPQASIT